MLVDLAMEYCYSETFEPRCATNEVIVMERAMFGRMSDQGRCLQPDSLMDSLKHDPRYLGCSHDVLPVTDRRCSGRTECSIRIVDPELQQNSPCYREMEKYMDASYTCVNVTYVTALIFISSCCTFFSHARCYPLGKVWRTSPDIKYKINNTAHYLKLWQQWWFASDIYYSVQYHTSS